MAVVSLKKSAIPSYKRHPDHGDSASIERLLATNLSVEDFSHVQRHDPRRPTRHKGSEEVMSLAAPPKRKKHKRAKFRDEAVQVTLVDQEKKMKQQQMILKKMAQDNGKLETQVRTYEQRLKEMRQDAVYRDLSGKEPQREGFCIPVRQAFRSLRNLIRTGWFRFWLKLQIKLEEKHRRMTTEDIVNPALAMSKCQLDGIPAS